ncbi:MAG: Ig-like domain repeat protein [Gemmatimonadales bacterium]|nr:Ig-like domain repeat protein [Gemmatimonadales bacterium]
MLACNGGDLVLPSEGEPAAIDVVEGDGQSGRVGVALVEPIVGRVTDSQGRPVADVPVAFVFTDVGGDATVAPDTATTNADGRASFLVVTGTRVGGSGAELRVSTAGGLRALAAPVAFTAVSADANELRLVGGDNQSAAAGAVLAEPLVVQVTDAFGNPIPGVPITWTPDAGGSVSQETTPTGEDGLAFVVRTLGATAGAQHTAASAPGLAGSPATFVHTASAGAATLLELVSGSGQVAVVGTSTPEPLVVRARDGSGNPVPGLAVAWLVGDGSGSLTPETSITDGDGLASTLWTLGTAPGANTATAVISGVGIVGFSATAVQGTPPVLSLEIQPPAGAARGVVLSSRPVVQLREPAGVPRLVPGVPVSVSVVEGGATLLGTLTRPTDVSGRAEFADLALVGPAGTYTLAFSAAGYTGVNSSAIALARAPTSTTIRSDDPDPSAAGAPVRVTFQVQSPGGTPTGSVRVSADDGTSCIGAVSIGECTLSPTAAGTRTLTAAYSGDTQFEGSAGTASHRVDAPLSPVLALRTQPSGSATAGQPFSRQPVVQLRDGQGGELRTAGVVVTVSIAAGAGTLGGPPTSTTDAGGRAAFTGLSIGGATGQHALRFTAVGYTPVISESIDVQSAPLVATTTTITADLPDPSNVGQPVTVAFTVTAGAGTPSGTVTVTASGGETCAASVGSGSCSITFATAGARTLTATYGGAAGFAGSSDTDDHTVSAAPPPPGPDATVSSVNVEAASIGLGGSTGVVVTVRSSAAAPLSNVSVTLSATGSGNTIAPGSALTNAQGEVRFAFSSTDAGTKTFTAVAGGVTLAQRPTIEVAQGGTATTITSDDPEPSRPGAPIEVRFTVTSDGGTPSGDVNVSATGGGTCAGTVAQGGCMLTPGGGPGTVTLSASYAGNSNFAASSDTEFHSIEAAPPSVLALLTQPSSTATSGVPFTRQPVVQLRSANGDELGIAGVAVSVETASGGGTLGGTTPRITDAAGRATFTDLSISGATGSHTLRFSATGFTGVTSETVDVQPPPPAATTTTITADTPEPSEIGQPVNVGFTVTATSGTPAGTVTVTVSDGSETCLATVAAGACDITLAAAGTRTLTASYAGSSSFSPSSDAEPHVVNAPPPPVPSSTQSDVTVADETIGLGSGTDVLVTVRSASGALLNNSAVTLSATGSGNTISPSSASTNGQGQATFDFRSTDAGAKTLTAVADGVTLADQPTVTVAQAATTTTVTSDTPEPSAPGAPVTVQFTVTSDVGTPAGDVNVTASGGGSCAGTVAEGGCTLTPGGGAGTVTLTASYAGSANFAGSSVTEAHTIEAPASTATAIVSHDPDPSPLDQAVAVQFTVGSSAGTPSGSVTVSASASETCTATVAEASCLITFTSSGDRTLTATYAGTATFEGSADTDGHIVLPPEGTATP